MSHSVSQALGIQSIRYTGPVLGQGKIKDTHFFWIELSVYKLVGKLCLPLGAVLLHVPYLISHLYVNVSLSHFIFRVETVLKLPFQILHACKCLLPAGPSGVLLGPDGSAP